ncbi:MAG: hypothetical protein ABSG33_10620 [Candidatus Bathyarchaeia archaeon]|jgi:hypothetical protein
MEKAFGHEKVSVAAHAAASEKAAWMARWTIQKFVGDFPGMTPREIMDSGVKPYESLELEGNCLLNCGINSIIWKAVNGGLTSPLNATYGCIGVGDSTTAASASQTGLQASSNYLWVVATSVTVGSSQQMVVVANFSSGQANYVWNEICAGVAPSGLPSASAAPPGSGTALNRLVSTMGTKASGTTWTATLTVSLQ